MLMRWEKKLDIFGPIEQAARCLDLWLKEEGRILAGRQKQRVAALMARYFHYEDEVTDALMLSFLRHYSGQREIDMEDPTSVRREIKAVLDKSQVLDGTQKKITTAFAVGIFITATIFGLWEVQHIKISTLQQTELKSLVHQIDALDETATTAKIWAETKQPLKIRSYQDLSYWDYLKSRKALETRLAALQSRAGAGM